MNNILTVVFEPESSTARASGLWQYDYGQILRIQGLDLPKAVEIHFSLDQKSGESIARIGTTKDGVTDAPIPDSMLEYDTNQNYNIYAFVFLSETNSGNTEYRITIPVKARPKPEIPGTPEEPELFREAIGAVNQAADRSETARDQAADSAFAAEKSSENADKIKAEVEELAESIKQAGTGALKNIQNQEDVSKQSITSHTDEEIVRINKNVGIAEENLQGKIKSAGTMQQDLEESTSQAKTMKTAVDQSTEAAGNAKQELNESISKATTANETLTETINTADTSKTDLDKTIQIATTLDNNLGTKITEGTALNKTLQSTGEKAASDIQTEADAQLQRVQTAVEGIKADREQINQNKEDIASLKKDIKNQSRSIINIQSAIKELNKKMSVDTYDELAEALASGNIEDYVSIGDELMVNKIDSLSITSSNASLSFKVSDEQKFIQKVGRIDDDTYVFEYRNGAWLYLERAVDTSDFGFAVKGVPAETDLLYVKMNYTQVSHTFVDFDPSGENATHPRNPNVKHFAIVEQTYVRDAFNYDYPESAVCITPGCTLPAGKYYIYNISEATSDWWCNYKRLYYVFEIVNDITATEETGDIQLRYYSRSSRETDGDARGVYELICKPYCCATEALYNSDTVKFMAQVAQPDEEYIDLRTIENFSVDQSMTSTGIIYNNLGHVCYGNNEWNVSNLRQRMNNADKIMKPVRMHKNDTLNGMYNAKGFMWGLDPRFVKLIKPCIVSIEHGVNDEFKRYQLYTCKDIATLLSMKEMSFNIQTDEGQVTKLYDIYTENQLTNTAVASRAKARQVGGTPQDYRWSRSANANSSDTARLVAPSGANDNSTAVSGNRFAPAYVIGVAVNQESFQSAEA